MGAAASDFFAPYADVQYGFLDDELGILNFHALAAKGDFHRVSACLKKGLDPNRPSFDDDDDYAREDTPMICAARGTAVRRGRKRHLKTLDVLFRFGGDVNKHNYLEQTPLYIACEKNLPTIAQWLVTHGADVNKSTKVGVSPLLCAYRNGNAEIVKLLLDHGAKAIDPPREFCSIQFPTIAKELRGENVDEPADSSVSSNESDGEDDGGTAATITAVARPASSYLRLRPPWKSKTEPTEATSLPTLALPTARPTPPAAAPPAASQEDCMRAAIEAQQKHQQQQRDVVLTDLDEKRRIDEQREYREKLAVDNAKRKAKRRRQREKATYDKYVARVEQKRREHSAPTPLRATTAPSGADNGRRVAIGLQWSELASPCDALQEQRRHIHTAPSRAGRPTWVPQEVYTTQVAPTTAASRQAGDDRLLRESRAVFDAVQAQHDRRERLKLAYTATMPSPSVLPPLAGIRP